MVDAITNLAINFANLKWDHVKKWSQVGLDSLDWCSKNKDNASLEERKKILKTTSEW